MEEQEHHCNNIDSYPTSKFLQQGSGAGSRVLIVGESLARDGWRKSGRAFYTTENRLLPTGRILNKLLSEIGLSVENCGFTEIAKCYIGHDRKLLNECGKKCWGIFLRQIDVHGFKLIILLGKKTLEIFNNEASTDLKTGQLEKIRLLNKEYLILPILHPSPANPYGYTNNIKIFTELAPELTNIIHNKTS